MAGIPEVTIDLRLSPEERWVEMLEKHGDTVIEVMESVEREVESWGWKPLVWFEKKAASLFRHVFGSNEYIREINAIAEFLGIDKNLLYAANLGYDLTSWSGANEKYFNRFKKGGCTGFIDGDKPLLARNMDWDWPAGIGDQSMVIRFTDGLNEFVTVGFPGHIGAISGLSSCGFSLTVNQAFAPGLVPAWTSLPVTWQMRSIFERAPSYAAAEKLLYNEQTLTGVFFLLCGEKAGEAVLVESDGRNDVITRAGKEEYLAIANHFLSEEFENVDPGWIEEDSGPRLKAIEKGVESTSSMTVAAAKKILNKEPVYNDATVHQIVMVGREMHLRCPPVSNRWKTYRVK